MSVRSLVPDSLKPWARSVRARVVPQQGCRAWKQRQFAMPAPLEVKRQVLMRFGRATDTWIETGTYMGDTTAYLSARARHVHSIEPEPSLARKAKQRFAAVSNVTILEGLSEDFLGQALTAVEGPVSLWLDGHFSAGITFQGPSDTPIRAELATIAEFLPRLGAVTVLVDDVRCFDPTLPEYSTYPPRTWLVEWADAANMTWTIEHDIFAAWR